MVVPPPLKKEGLRIFLSPSFLSFRLGGELSPVIKQDPTEKRQTAPILLKTANERLATYGKGFREKNATEQPALCS